MLGTWNKRHQMQFIFIENKYAFTKKKKKYCKHRYNKNSLTWISVNDSTSQYWHLCLKLKVHCLNVSHSVYNCIGFYFCLFVIFCSMHCDNDFQVCMSATEFINNAINNSIFCANFQVQYGLFLLAFTH